MPKRLQPTGMTAFTIIWFGQLVSLLGSGMTTFAISIWAWEETGKATALALAMFFGFGPQVILSPLAGAIVDRYDRKLVMIASDLAAGLATIALFILLNLDQLEIWHLYVANAFAGAFGAFQFPAYSAAVTVMIPKEHYGRANGMIALAGSASGIFAPIIAGAMIGLIGIGGIMTFDIITFVFAIAMVLLVHIPQPRQSKEGQAAKGNLWQESMFGFKYIFARPSLLGLQLIFFFINLTAMFSFSLTVPMILARTGNDELILGSAQSLGAIGGVAGGLLLSVWGGPKRRVYGVLGGMFLISLLGGLPMGVGRSLFSWALGGFMTGFVIPILNGSNQAIWQAKVQPDLQGRVFAVRRLIAQISAPIAMLSAGPLADRVFEPAMAVEGSLAGTFGWLVGTGPGAGMGLMFVITATLGAFIGLGGFLFPAVRNVEDIMPDHDAVLQVEGVDEMEAVPV
ncbi:MAG TPA: MFS transporter [Anaerolineales bacterium]|nr:MFS transporter [Anaerolineales bacterium]